MLLLTLGSQKYLQIPLMAIMLQFQSYCVHKCFFVMLFDYARFIWVIFMQFLLHNLNDTQLHLHLCTSYMHTGLLRLQQIYQGLVFFFFIHWFPFHSHSLYFFFYYYSRLTTRQRIISSRNS